MTILDYFTSEFLSKIPINVVKQLNKLASKFNKNIQINLKKGLQEQDISEDTKDMISLIYYNYVADKKEKQELLNVWSKNEANYQKYLNNKYNIDKVFDNKKKNIIQNNNKEIIQYKESIFQKFLKIFKKKIKRLSKLENKE